MPSFTTLRPRAPVGVALADLLGIDGVRLVSGSPGVRVTGVTVDSGDLRPGDLFVALQGANGHGIDHCSVAVRDGAVAVLTDPTGAARTTSASGSDDAVAGLPVLVADDPRRVLGAVAATVHGTDRRAPTLFGVTGTNGKTTTVHLLDALLERTGTPAGRSTTADRRSGTTVVESRLTTPEAPELHALLARMVEDGVQAAAVEVSAQALTRHRVDGIRFAVVGFTNLSHDHMDDYGSMAAYLAAKAELFQRPHADRGVVVVDTDAGRTIRDRASIPVATISSEPGVPADWTLTVGEVTADGTAFVLDGPVGAHLAVRVPLIGRHMALDAALALVMLHTAGWSTDELAAATSPALDVVVPGRTARVATGDGPRVYTDFSHTPDSIEKTLAALREVSEGPLVVVVGADGDKDPSKRVPMGRAAAVGADHVVVTDHHPRFEDPGEIRRALLEGARGGAGRPGGASAVDEVADPARAIRTAIRAAGAHGTVLWVGPGQTDYRVVGAEDVPYSPRADARVALAEAGWRVEPPASPDRPVDADPDLDTAVGSAADPEPESAVDAASGTVLSAEAGPR